VRSVGRAPGLPVKVAGWSIAEVIAFGAFLFWGAAGLISTLGHFSLETIAHWPMPEGLARFVTFCLQHGDPILILLAFINTHLHAARQWNPDTARRWAAIVLIAAFCIETFGTITGLPFGNYQYTDEFGPRLWLVPLAIPLAWHVVVTNALFIVRALVPHCARLTESALVGLLCTLYDFVLEPFATTVRHYWIWTEGAIPLLNYVAWLILSALLVWFFAPTLSTRLRLDPRPWLILGLTLTIFIAGRWQPHG
jgi:uncharacterized membrane protein